MAFYITLNARYLKHGGGSIIFGEGFLYQGYGRCWELTRKMDGIKYWAIREENCKKLRLEQRYNCTGANGALHLPWKSEL